MLNAFRHAKTGVADFQIRGIMLAMETVELSRNDTVCNRRHGIGVIESGESLVTK